MNEILIKGYEILTVVAPCFTVYVLLNKTLKRENNAVARRKHIFLLCVFAFYIFGVFYFTGAGTIYDVQRVGLEIRGDQINLVPFSNDIDFLAYLLNIVLFIPLGFLVPLIWKNTRRFSVQLVYGLSFSLLIEFSQLLNSRASDIDDPLMNTLGAVLGYLTYTLFARIVKEKRVVVCSKSEPVIYICAMFLGHFLLYNGYGVAKMLYGF